MCLRVGFGTHFWTNFLGPPGTHLGPQIGPKSPQNRFQNGVIFGVFCFAVSGGFFRRLREASCLFLRILGAPKARKWLPFACFQPSTFSPHGALDASSEPFWARLGPLRLPKWPPSGGQKLAQNGSERGPEMDPKIYNFLDKFLEEIGP